MNPDYEAQFQRFYYDLYSLSYCLAWSEKAQEERRQTRNDGEAPAVTKMMAGPNGIDQIFRIFEMARRVSGSAGAFFGAPGQFETRIKGAASPKEFLDIFRELMLVMKHIHTEFTEEQQQTAARHFRQKQYGITDDDILNAQMEMEKEDIAEFLSQFYESGEPSLRQMSLFSANSDFESFRPEGGFTQAHAKLEQDLENSKERAIRLLCSGAPEDVRPRLYTLNQSIRSILSSREAGSVFTSAIDSAIFHLSKNSKEEKKAFMEKKLPDVIARAFNAVVGDRYRRNDVDGAARILDDLNRLTLNAAMTQRVSRNELENGAASKSRTGFQEKPNLSDGMALSQHARKRST